MIHNILRGAIVKSSCVDVMIKDFLGLGVKYSEITAMTLSFYTTKPSQSIDKTLTDVVITGNSVVVHFEPVELESMEDGVLRYSATYEIDEDEYLKDMDSPFYLKTPINHEEIDFASMEEVEEYVSGVTSGMAKQSDLLQYAKKTEIPTVPTKVSAFQNDAGYLTQHQDLSAYALKTEIPSLNGYATQNWVLSKNYLTEHQSLADYATMQWVLDKGYLTEHQDLSAYAKKTELPVVPTLISAFQNDKGYLTEHQDLSAYALKSEVPSLDGYATENWVLGKNYLTEHQPLDAYAQKSWVEGKGYLTEHQSLAGYATENWVNSKGYLTEHQDLTDYAKKSWVNSQGFLTQHQDLSDYAKKTDLPTEVSELTNDAGYLTEHQSLTDYYTKAQVNALFDNIENLQMVITAQLPETGRTNIIYLVPKTTSASTDGYDEYIYMPFGGGWEKIGNTTANLTGYATQSWVNNQGFLTEHQSLKTINGQAITGTGNIVIEQGSQGATYAAGANIKISADHVISVTGITSYTGVTKQEVTDALGYVPAKKTEIPSLTGYATENWVLGKNYLTQHQSLAGYATQDWVNNQGFLKEHQSLTGYATETWVEGKNYTTKTYVDGLIGDINNVLASL